MGSFSGTATCFDIRRGGGDKDLSCGSSSIVMGTWTFGVGILGIGIEVVIGVYNCR